MIPSAYLLAAGRGRRAGEPKAWLLHEGVSLLARHLELHPAAVVSVQPPWMDRCRAMSPAAIFVPVDPDLPAFASLHAMLKAAPPQGPAFVLHVDHPVWDRSVFEALTEHMERAEGAKRRPDAAVPTFNRRRGHPVLLSQATLETAARLDPRHDRLDEFLRTRETIFVPVESPSILENWNAGPQSGKDTMRREDAQ